MNKPVLVHTTTTSASLRATIRGREVTIVATPIRYQWDFDEVLVASRDPSAPYPDHTVQHTYNRAGPRTLSLSITWEIEYRENPTDPWRTATSTLRTTSEPQRIELVTARARLAPAP